jgi:hypothetical protein
VHRLVQYTERKDRAATACGNRSQPTATALACSCRF